jgi:alkylation response protein AidB-like acyl-CoA dehydrogenase
MPESYQMVVLPKNDPQTYRDIEAMTRRFATDAIRPEAEILDRDELFPDHLYKQMANSAFLELRCRIPSAEQGSIASPTRL